MKTKKFDSEEAWLNFRKGKVTGTRLKDLVSKNDTKKIGFYEILAERIAVPASEENVMDRGHRLEDDAVELFEKKTGKKCRKELIVWHRDEDENITVSPDASIGKTESLEIKCLSSARHLEAYINKKIPNEYWHQVLQYFIVNDKLKKLYFVFYDPRSPIEIFWIEVERKNLKKEIAEYLELERRILVEIEKLENQLTF